MSELQAHGSRTEVLATQVAQLVKELQIQLRRIGEMQVQLDRLTAAQSLETRDQLMTGLGKSHKGSTAD